ncbi:MAG: hypothetical protein GY821_05205, partial [Gammaproteobacteria bacterium]|nr:hypothetical protein [Gammaproteobacteria bacterium]
MTQPLIIRRSGSVLIAALIIWLIYTGLYIYCKHAGHSVIAGLFPLIGEAGLDLVAAVLAYFIWIRTKTRIALFGSSPVLVGPKVRYTARLEDIQEQEGLDYYGRITDTLRHRKLNDYLS